MELTPVCVLTLFIIAAAIFCIFKCLKMGNGDREGMSGFGVISALNLYNRPAHCWSDDEGGQYCSTNSTLMV
jgi:hypothetical protein